MTWLVVDPPEAIEFACRAEGLRASVYSGATRRVRFPWRIGSRLHEAGRGPTVTVKGLGRIDPRLEK